MHCRSRSLGNPILHPVTILRTQTLCTIKTLTSVVSLTEGRFNQSEVKKNSLNQWDPREDLWEGWSSRREKKSSRREEANKRWSEDGERLPVFEESGGGMYQKLTFHNQSRNTGQEWSEVINDGLMFRTACVQLTIYVKIEVIWNNSRAADDSWTVSFALTSGYNLRPTWHFC